MAANDSGIVGQPKIVEAQDSITRPSDTTQYAVGDAISNNATTPTAAGYFELDLGGGGLTLLDFTLHKSDQDQTGAEFALLLFTTAPAFAGWEDNAASAITDDEMKECKGVVRFEDDQWNSVGTGDIQTQSMTIGVVLATGVTKVYGILIAQGTYTPASAEVFTLTVHAIRD